MNPIDIPHVWRGQEMARVAAGAVLPTGFAALDAQLPGGGWPAAGLVELLQGSGGAGQGLHGWALLAPALGALAGLQESPIVLVGGPAHCTPFAPALAAHGVAPQRLLWVRAGTPEALLWACEQALRCADVCAVLAWLPGTQAQVPAQALRRLHVGAVARGKPLWALRPEAAQRSASAAPLRLLLSGAPAAGAADTLRVQVLKRRGPPLQEPLELPAHYGPRMAALLAARRKLSVAPLSVSAPEPTALRKPAKPSKERHALAGLVTA